MDVGPWRIVWFNVRPNAGHRTLRVEWGRRRDWPMGVHWIQLEWR